MLVEKEMQFGHGMKFFSLTAKLGKKGNETKCKGCGVQMQGLVAQMRNHKSVGKCDILNDVQDDENIHFCQDTVENINQPTDEAQTSPMKQTNSRRKLNPVNLIEKASFCVHIRRQWQDGGN